MKPDRVVVGTDNPRARASSCASLRSVHPQSRQADRHGHALRRAHEVRGQRHARDQDQLHERAGEPRRALGRRHREGARRASAPIRASAISFIYPGCGYGGSCFPKDVQALGRSAARASATTRAAQGGRERSTSARSRCCSTRCCSIFGGKLRGKTIALWGLAFKPNTDDMREAPSRALIGALWAPARRVRAYDPEAEEAARRSTASAPIWFWRRGRRGIGAPTRWRSDRMERVPQPDFGYEIGAVAAGDLRRPQPLRPCRGQQPWPAVLRDWPGRFALALCGCQGEPSAGCRLTEPVRQPTSIFSAMLRQKRPDGRHQARGQRNLDQIADDKGQDAELP